MSGIALGLVTLLILATTGVLTSASLRIRGTSHLVLAVYIVVFAEVVLLSLLLSPFAGFTRGNLIGGTVVLFVVSLAVWLLAGSPRLALVPAIRRTKPILSPSVLLGAFVALGLAYLVALILGTAPNGWDPLNYHLARAAFWVQSGRVGYIEPTYDERLNLNPPNGEIGTGFVLAVTHDEVLVGFVQFFAALACAVAVYALARRLGARRVEAIFGCLLFLSLPIVLLQASLAKNDLVIAAALLSASVFVLETRRSALALAMVATALAVGTKATGLYGILILFCLAFFAGGARLRLARLTAVAAGGILGSYWFVWNIAETGHFFGDQSAQHGVSAPFHGAPNVLTAYGMLVDTFDVSGAEGRDILLYGIGALVVAAVLFISQPGRWKRQVLAGAVVSSPFVLFLVGKYVGRPSLTHLYDALGKPEGYLGTGAIASPTVASDTASWFGSVGFLGTLAVALVAVERRGAKALVAATAAAPFVWFALVALTLTYNPWLGRFFIYPVALSAALWGFVLRVPAAAWGAAALGAITVVLTLVHYTEKPSGLRLLDRSAVDSVWTMPRWQVQSQHDPPLAPLLEFVDKRIPPKASVALALSNNDFGYPIFGPHLDRHVDLIPFGSSGRDTAATWLLASPERLAEIDGSCWSSVFQSTEGSVLRRLRSCVTL